VIDILSNDQLILLPELFTTSDTDCNATSWELTYIESQYDPSLDPEDAEEVPEDL